MRVHCLQHVPFEGPGALSQWAEVRGHSFRMIALWRGDGLPDLRGFEALIVLGGSMSVHQEVEFPWLKAEKDFLARAVDARKVIFGVCLGAQLISLAMGGEVTRAAHKEIGWFPVKLTQEASESAAFGVLPEEFVAFHWHGDQFSTPRGAVRAAESEACRNQAFVFDDRVVGVQFHLELTSDSIGRLISHCEEDLRPGPYVQKPQHMLAQRDLIRQGNLLSHTLLDSLAGRGR
jgi:GMP synthase-like glutamine amidotransferase